MKREADDDDEEVEKETDGLAGRTGPDVGERLPPARPRQCGGLQRVCLQSAPFPANLL